MTDWYYVQGSERVGPVDDQALASLLHAGTLNKESYIWKKGFDNWKHFRDVSEVAHLLNPPKPAAAPKMPDPVYTRPTVDWNRLDSNDRLFHIKIGLDRGGDETEYGPFTLNELKRAFDEQRINGKTFIFTSGMDNWMFLADIPVYQKFFAELPPVIDEIDRRVSVRKPFVARLLFHDDSVVYEGICRDISVGGLQILVSNFPAKLGDEITLNVHPDNTDYCFVATGLVVRVLDGNQGFSMRFKKLTNEAREAIETYLANS